MLEAGILEIMKGIGNLFINPLLYWIIVLFFATSYKRIRVERQQFGTKIFPFFSEGKSTLFISIAGCIVISLIAVTFGIVLTNDLVLIITLVTILLSITASLSLLSVGYTIGISFLIALILPYLGLFDAGQTGSLSLFKVEYFIGLAFLAGILLLMEAILLFSKKAASFPQMVKSERGVWIGRHHLKRLAFIPFFCLFPATDQLLTLPIIPYFNIGDEPFMLILFPFVIGFDYKVLAELPVNAARRIGRTTLLLAAIVIVVAVISVYLPIISIAAILIAIIGKEWLMYINRKKNSNRPSLFHPLDRGAMVLATIPNSPAARLGIQIGETILKVNNHVIENGDQFYEALQNSGAFFKLEIRDVHGEVRFINSALYENDHHELGVVFVEERFKINKKVPN